ncbi:RNA 2',3'-cyclic phosphodiesterase [Thermopolyspora flexuosa]|uniref:RNA 2',3'-cyclic phosphodiesterase n=1 Tax=Thermopolyspora flexuosa TaxID=103836 RepID=A0A543IS27_9ACTN|nr:RNA 2',3'-cyclic phosphodiesterase [Thermopolyspora flexuosa]PZN44698.1 MAG: RNA 2',3'-cyclic phosphodiesterase [Actinomycetota bacterium]TQM73383.1 2'-5' RNA ligase [Thermopolyspora flexuosa]GGM80644.1 RNA 2',3'-cyclic phosphodiesterase [Thermopolyspora flexuosa]
MRLFVALLPPDDVLAEIEEAVRGPRAKWPELRWVPEELWHVTLAFLGNVDEELLPGLQDRLERAAARHPVQQVAFAGAGAFPSAGRASVFWVGMRGAAEEERERPVLGRLARSIAAGAERAGAAPDRKRFHPHLTLARCRERTDLSRLVAAMESFAGRRWEATTVYLMRSHLGRSVWYEPIASWPLRGDLADRPAAGAD